VKIIYRYRLISALQKIYFVGRDHLFRIIYIEGMKDLYTMKQKEEDPEEKEEDKKRSSCIQRSLPLIT